MEAAHIRQDQLYCNWKLDVFMSYRVHLKVIFTGSSWRINLDNKSFEKYICITEKRPSVLFSFVLWYRSRHIQTGWLMVTMTGHPSVAHVNRFLRMRIQPLHVLVAYVSQLICSVLYLHPLVFSCCETDTNNASNTDRLTFWFDLQTFCIQAACSLICKASLHIQPLLAMYAQHVLPQ